ncbi:MAG: cytochrome c biogenesis protein CcdA [Thermodesulfobacteriota bacterium]|nr:cytochrome c biogenesis protein CcdA [Thermodesulfobacteriota bacterium]
MAQNHRGSYQALVVMVRGLLSLLSRVSIFFFLSLPAFMGISHATVANVTVLHSQDQYPAGGSYPIVFEVNISPPWFLHGPTKSDDGLIPSVFSCYEVPGIKIDNIRFPPPELKKFDYSKEKLEVYSEKIQIHADMMVAEEAQVGKRSVEYRFSYQACTNTSCLPPETVQSPFALVIAPQGTEVVLQNREIFASASDMNEGALVPGLRLTASLWLTLLSIFLAGLALNLTPCIYPLIPITVSYFGGRSQQIKGKTIIHGILYISGLAFTNSILGVGAAFSGGMLGTACQNPFVLVLVAGILVAFALSFFGLWELRIPTGLTNLASKNFGGFFGTFFMGLTLGIVAAPCLGPFILGLLTYVGQKGDPLIGFVYFFVLSIGMGLPLSLLAVFSGTLEKLPMSGEWMIWVRKLLGWVLLGMGVYMIQPLVRSDTMEALLFAAVLAGAGVHLGWLDKSRSAARGFAFLKRGLGTLLIGVAIVVFISGSRTAPHVDWAPYDRSVIESCKGNRPVILDVYADWCVPCRGMENEVFNHPDIVTLSKRFLTMRIDLTKRHPEQEEIQKRYQIRGVPTIIFIDRQGVEKRALRVEAHADRHEILDRMKQVLAFMRDKERP